MLSRQAPSGYVKKEDDDTKKTAKLEDLACGSSLPMMTESGVIIKPANFVSTENQGKKEDATDDKYNKILEKVDALTSNINQAPESENEDNIEAKYSAILGKLDTLIEEEKQKATAIPQGNIAGPVEDIDNNPIIEMVSTKIDEAEASQSRELEKMQEQLSNSIDTLVKLVEKHALSFDNIYNMLAERMEYDHKYRS